MENELDDLKGKFGLIGKSIEYSFSRSYFNQKFKDLNLPYRYVNFDLSRIQEFNKIPLLKEKILGLNVTIPYKEAILPFLNELDLHAQNIGAVNTIKILPNQGLKGYNTDFLGFKNSLRPLLSTSHKKALILGSGGASKAVSYALDQLELENDVVSRSLKTGVKYSYDMLTKAILSEYQIIINCSPVGTFPKVEESVNIPYDGIAERCICYDLVYNPPVTKFMKRCLQNGATVKNGYEMLEIQAEEAWKIWNQE